MAEETKVGMKLDMELEPIKEMCKKLEEAVKHELSKGIENVDAKELGEVVDMIKDLYEAKEKIVKACYYKGVLEAMEEHDFEDEDEIEDEGRRGYRGQPRSQSGRFMRRGDGRRSNRGRSSRRGYEDMMMYDDMDYDEMERMRDMDRPYGRMGYSGSGSSGSSSMGGSQGQSSGMSSGSMGSQGGSRGYSDGGRGQSSRSESARRGYEESKMMQDGSPESKKKAMESLESYLKELSEDMTDLVSKMDANEKSMVKNKLQVLAQKVS